jgi:hypothetical protein
VHETALERNRRYFRAGWCASGADPGKADEMFDAIQSGEAHKLLNISDFDDSPAALGVNPGLAALEKEIDNL